MNKVKFVSKGYTLEVVSWENDGDNYRTKHLTVETKDEALAVKHLCENLFQSNYDPLTIGNKMDDEAEECMLIAARYLLENPFLLSLNKETKKPQDLEKEIRLEYEKELKDDSSLKWEELLPEYLEQKEDLVGEWWDSILSGYNYKLLGGSEYYFSRVCDSVKILYSPEDVYLEEVV
tara:strand:- start:7127 stop:7657 length:531 start_codon:yes stop_codon:yes gene_type:complete